METVHKHTSYRAFDAVAVLFCSTLIISDTIAVKIVDVGGVFLPAGTICFPLSYIINDVLTEVYGFTRARRTIWFGFGCSALMAGFYYLAGKMSPAPFWPNQRAFEVILGQAPRIVAASVAAYLIGSFLNAIVLSKMKIMTRGKHLWMRTIASTIVGEGADSFVFCSLAFGGTLPMDKVLLAGFYAFAAKTLIEIVATPATYMVVAGLKRYEEVDVFDLGVTYNPFGLEM